MRTITAKFGLGLGLLFLAACSPSLDWREVRPEGADLVALFPCKPEVMRRPADGPAADGTRPQAGLAVCKAGGHSFSLSWSDVGDPGQITPALHEMRESLATKLAAQSSEFKPVALTGMTPSAEAGQVSLLGRTSEGGAQMAEVLVFAKGRRVHRLVMMGAKRDTRAWETFIGGLRLAEP